MTYNACMTCDMEFEGPGNYCYYCDPDTSPKRGDIPVTHRHDVINNLVRIAARHGFNFEEGYVTDFIWDVNMLEKLEVGETAYILVRNMGSTWCKDLHDVRIMSDPAVSPTPKVLIKLTRNKHFDLCSVEVVDLEAALG